MRKQKISDDPHCTSLEGEVIPNCFHFNIDSSIGFVESAALVFTLADDTNGEILQLSEIEPITPALGETVQIDITSAIREWTIEQRNGHTIQLTRCGLCSEQNGCVLCRSGQFIAIDSEVSPIIQISLPRSVSTRRRRSSNCSPDGSCCLHHMYVNFTEIG
uniref:TGF-beta family profile domain-containing protein n=1 Tax=Parascaris equorum TaxID=6256 RepID=A0A914RJ59_PAREQ